MSKDPQQSPAVMACAALPDGALSSLFEPFGLQLRMIEDGAPIPGSFWGDREAGLLGGALLLRADTPVHSALHEGCHWICMDDQRRVGLDTDAGGDDAEECAVCFLQVLLADHLAGYDRQRLFQDMDAWGYSFRLGSARAWFENDAEDARQWLHNAAIIDPRARVLALNAGSFDPA